MDLLRPFNLGVVNYDFAKACDPLRMASVSFTKMPHAAGPATLDLDAIGADPARNADDLAPAHAEGTK